MDYIEILKKYNNFKDFNFGFERKEYLDFIIQSLGTSDLIKVLIWQRRVWKSFILKQIINFLLKEKKISEKNILYINFEYEIFSQIKNSEKLENLIKKYFENINWKKYIFLDEVQEIDWWEKLVNSFRADHTFECEIFITWSNSKLLSWDLATYISWRYIEFEIFPFSYNEYLDFYKKENSKNNFLDYINFSWLPELYNLDNKDLQYIFVKSLKDTIILKDLVKKYSIKEVDLLEKVFLFLINNIWNSLSINSLRKKLLQEWIKTTSMTLWNYLKYFEEVFVFFWVSRFDLHWKKILEWEKKYYLNDLSFLNFLFSSFESFILKKLENYVFNFFKRKWYKISIGKLKNLEIDFVVEKQNKKIYIQVAYLLASEEIISREYWNLRKINDSFEKYVLSLDDFNFWVDDKWIKHHQIWKIQDIF